MDGWSQRRRSGIDSRPAAVDNRPRNVRARTGGMPALFDHRGLVFPDGRRRAISAGRHDCAFLIDAVGNNVGAGVDADG